MKVSNEIGLNPKTNIEAEKKSKIDPKAAKVAQEFEALFLDLMLKSMRRTASSETESNAEGIYKSMLDTEYAKNMASNQSFGIKELILDWMQKQHPESVSTTDSLKTDSELNAAQEVKSALDRTENMSLQEMHSKMAVEIYKMQSKAAIK